ncbi:hypothetical protein ACLIKD_00765 [Azonexus sp. IMCC34842]|uniref:hypothetical protein n=1 Tax=Azonexus sp. IMCC34842 TaxID=3420950 RepID=UPI003D11DFA3
MCDVLVWSLDAIRWPETISALAAVITATIAFYALQTWRHQDKAKGKAEFLDALIEAAHTYIAEMPKPMTLLVIAKVGMQSHIPPRGNREQADTAIEGAISYIQKNGEHDGKHLHELLVALQPSVIKLKSLAAKGQVFKFNDYVKCKTAVAELTQHFETIEAFMAVIRSPTWNWENPEVLNLLKQVMAIDPEEIRKSLQKNNIALLEFAGETYMRIYG